ncbi:hypothetical protein MNBD_ALPHA08-1970, partial [hydrothermal vent metagenome]
DWLIPVWLFHNYTALSLITGRVPVIHWLDVDHRHKAGDEGEVDFPI